MQQFSGIKIAITEVGLLFVNYNKELALIAPLIANGIQDIATCFSPLITTRFGRKMPIIVGCFSLSMINLITAVLFLVYEFHEDQGLIYAAFASITLF